MTPLDPLQDAIARCESGDAKRIDPLLEDLRDEKYLDRLDDDAVYQERVIPPNLRRVLESLGDTRSPKVADAFVALSKLKPYSRTDSRGSLRRFALIEGAGHARPNPALIAMLDEAVVEDGKYRVNAVGALAGLGSPEALATLWKHVFGPQNRVIPEEQADIYLPIFTTFLGQYRNRPAVLSFMLDELPKVGLRREVVRCLVEDVVQHAPDPHGHYRMAPLEADTEGAIGLAGILARWLVANAEDLGDPPSVRAIAGRVAALLGVQPATPLADDPAETRPWLAAVFQRASAQESDPKRRSAIEAARSSLK